MEKYWLVKLLQTIIYNRILGRKSGHKKMSLNFNGKCLCFWDLSRRSNAWQISGEKCWHNRNLAEWILITLCGREKCVLRVLTQLPPPAVGDRIAFTSSRSGLADTGKSSDKWRNKVFRTWQQAAGWKEGWNVRGKEYHKNKGEK